LSSGDDGMSASEVWLEKGFLVKLTSNPEFKYKCTNKTIYLDYDNIAKVIWNVFLVAKIDVR